MTSSRTALEAALTAAMASAGAMQWGRDDCVMWCADILHAGLGYDAARGFRGRYRTRIGAQRVLGKGGLAAALRGAARRQGWQRIQPGAEQTGDIGIAEIRGVASTVICRAPGWFIGRNAHGWTALPARLVRIIWNVL